MFGNKISLKQAMGRTHLLNRLIKPKVKGDIVFGSALDADKLSENAYQVLSLAFRIDTNMGYAEFETGAVPAALDFIAEEAAWEALVSGQIMKVYYICPKNYEEAVKQVIEALLTDQRKLNLKVGCWLFEQIAGHPSKLDDDVVGWLEIENGYFLFSDQTMFEATKQAFGVK